MILVSFGVGMNSITIVAGTEVVLGAGELVDTVWIPKRRRLQ
jgi:hypothetical protein